MIHTKIGVCLRFTSGQTVLVVIAKKFVQKINGFVRDIPLILGGNKASPRFPLVPAWSNYVEKLHSGIKLPYSPSQNLIVLSIELDIIFFKVCIQLICTQDLGDLHKLVVVVVAVEKGFFSENLNPYIGEVNMADRGPCTIDANMQPKLHMSRL